jgi:hydroxyacylglutathione hydrolase
LTLPELQTLTAQNPGPLTLDGTRTYVIGRSRPVVLDPGPDDAVHLERLTAVVGDRAVEAVCVTHSHADHAALAEHASKAFGAPLAGSAETLRRLGVPGRELADGDVLPVDRGASQLQALETPGHSADHLCFLWIPSRALFTGDLVLGRGSSVVLHPDGRVDSYLASLTRLAALRPIHILPGHGDAVADAVAKLEEYRAHRLEREVQIVDAIAAGARSPAEIRKKVYGEIPPGVTRAAELSILAHLDYLRERGHPLPEGTGEAEGQ